MQDGAKVSSCFKVVIIQSLGKKGLTDRQQPNMNTYNVIS